MLCFFFFVSDFKKYTITTINPWSQCLGQEKKNILRHYLFGEKIIQNCLKMQLINMIIISYWDKKLKKNCMSWKLIL